MTSSIDWMATGTWMQAWAGFAQAGAILFAAIRGANVFNTWRKQKIEERRLDTAESVLTLAYRIKRAFEAIRSPAMTGAALFAAEEKLRKEGIGINKLSGHARQTFIHSQAVYDRINSFSREWDELLAAIPVARAFFGVELEDRLQRLWQQRGVVAAAAESYGDDKGEDAEFTAQLKRNLWQGWAPRGGPSNEVDEAIKMAFNDIEAALQPILNSNAGVAEELRK